MDRNTIKKIQGRGVWLMLLFFMLPFSAMGEDVNWEEDCALMIEELYKRHPDLYHSCDSAGFNRAMQALAKRGGELGKFSMAVKMQQLVALLGDEHTQINYTHLVGPDKILPIAAYWFEDGIRITRCPGAYEEILGGRITAINGYPLDQVLDSLRTLIPGARQPALMNSAPRMLAWLELHEHFGFSTGAELLLRVESTEGGEIELEVQAGRDFERLLRKDALPGAIGYAHERDFFMDSLFADAGLYYIQYNRCWSRELEQKSGSGTKALFMPSFKVFQKASLARAKNPDISRLVLDLRFNGGGNSSQGTAYLKKLSKTTAGKNAEAFLLIGRKTQSSAMINAYDFIRMFSPRIIGEPSGGKPNHFGEVSRFVLPETGLVISCSTKYFRLLEGDPPTLEPEIPVALSFEDFIKGVDPAFEYVRNL